MTSYEKQVKDMVNQGGELPRKIDIGVMKYFWQISPFAASRKDNIPRFLRNIGVLKNFTDNELRILSKFLHERIFQDMEPIFKQGDLGIGFYFIYSGNVEIIVERDKSDLETGGNLSEYNLVIALDKFDYFGELALLQSNSIRSATAVAKNACRLMGIFKPDLDELISTYPVVATKLLQCVSEIIAERLFSLTREVRDLKYKLAKKEKIDDRAEK